MATFTVCWPCRESKRKCDHGRPCSRCLARNEADACLRVEPRQRRRGRSDSADEAGQDGRTRLQSRTLSKRRARIVDAVDAVNAVAAAAAPVVLAQCEAPPGMDDVIADLDTQNTSLVALLMAYGDEMVVVERPRDLAMAMGVPVGDNWLLCRCASVPQPARPGVSDSLMRIVTSLCVAGACSGSVPLLYTSLFQVGRRLGEMVAEPSQAWHARRWDRMLDVELGRPHVRSIIIRKLVYSQTGRVVLAKARMTLCIDAAGVPMWLFVGLEDARAPELLELPYAEPLRSPVMDLSVALALVPPLPIDEPPCVPELPAADFADFFLTNTVTPLHDVWAAPFGYDVQTLGDLDVMW